MPKVATIPAYILANENLLRWMLEHPARDGFRMDPRDLLREFAYVDFHRWNDTVPDHVFRHRWYYFTRSYLEQQRGNLLGREWSVMPGVHSRRGSIVLAALDCLVDEYIEFRGNQLHVRLERFGWWQNLLSRLSAVPVQAMAAWRLSQTDSCRFAAERQRLESARVVDSLWEEEERPLRDKVHVGRILYPYDAGVERYIEHHGLNDSHVHINMCAMAESCWLNALNSYYEEWELQKRAFMTQPGLVELYREIHIDLDPDVMLEHMRVALCLRYLLVNYAEDKPIREYCRAAEPALRGREQPGEAQQEAAVKTEKSENEESAREEEFSTRLLSVVQVLSRLSDTPPAHWPETGLSPEEGRPSVTHEHLGNLALEVDTEREWMKQVIVRLAEKPNLYVDRAFHLYLLLMNEYMMLRVQRDNFYGFKQFQKYSSMENPLVAGPWYYMRAFTVMHGEGLNSVANYAELRVSPRADVGRLRESVAHILCGYLAYVQDKLRGQNPGVRAQEMLTLQQSNLDVIHQALHDALQESEGKLRLVRPCIVFHFIKQEWTWDEEKFRSKDAWLLKSSYSSDDVAQKARGGINRPWEDRVGNRWNSDSGNQVGERDDFSRHGHARHQYTDELRAIRELLHAYPWLRAWVKGIDAAADELDTPPDVFAPIYRQARRELGIEHMTYHVGEDFYHLISGVRNVCEAVNLLDLRRGDRLGHATAVGVNPSLWLRTMPDHVMPTRGEWLQDLVFLWHLLSRVPDMQELLQKLDFDIREHGYAVFRRSHLSPYILKRVFNLRWLNPILLEEAFEHSATRRRRSLARVYEEEKDEMPRPFPESRDVLQNRYAHLAATYHVMQDEKRYPHPIEAEDEESRLIYDAFNQETPEVMELILNWQLDRETWMASESRIEVPTDYLSESELVILQQQAQHFLVERGIVLETLPTSNLRISQYTEMGQHHSLRWMGVSAFEGDTPPPVVLGSDDPGIFATDIKAEFYHIFASLCKRGLNSEHALEKLVHMNRSGIRYAFRSLTHNSPLDFYHRTGTDAERNAEVGSKRRQ